MSDTTNDLTARQVFDASARMRQLTGRSYPRLESELKRLSVPALIELLRFVSDAQSEITRIKGQAIREPWRLGR